MRPRTQVAGATTVLADHHPLWLDAIEGVAIGEGVAVVGRATTVVGATALVERHRPDLVIVGIDATGEFTDEFVRFVRGHCPSTKVVVLGEAVEIDAIEGALRAGAIAYVLKAAQPDDLALSITQAFSTSIFFNSLQGGVPKPPAAAPAPVAASEVATSDVAIGLTDRELEILAPRRPGVHERPDRSELWVTEQTVKFHLSNTYRKLGVANRTEASRYAQRHGLLSAPAAQPAAA